MTPARTWPHAGQPVIPDSSGDLAAWVQRAREQKVSIGGPLADHGIDFSALRQASPFNPADMVLTTGVGQTLDQVKAHVAAEGLWLPLDTPSGGSMPLADYLGNDLSLSWLSHRYGTARDWVMGMTAIDDSGSPVTWGAKVVKNVAGYLLSPLYIGSRHALGLMVEVSLRLIPLPTGLWRVNIAAPTPEPLLNIWRETVRSRGSGLQTDPWEAIRLKGQTGEWQLEGLTYAPRGEIDGWIGLAEGARGVEVTPCEGVPNEPVTPSQPVRIGRFLPANLGTIMALETGREEELIIYPATGAALFFGAGASPLAASIEASGGQVVEAGDGHRKSSRPGDDTALYMQKVKSILDPDAVFGPLWEAS